MRKEKLAVEEFRYFDAHVHLDWFADAREVARRAGDAGLGLFACTVEPDGFAGVQALGGERNVALACGFHPWWVAERGAENDAWLEAAVAGARASRWVGEVGLDFSRKHEATKDEQLRVFTAICEACAQESDAAEPKVISIHSAGAATAVMDVLEKTGVADACRCVLHWFSGTSAELARSRELGLWFSLGERSLATRRGREYARQIPAARLLSETDLPDGQASAMDEKDILASLDRAIAGIAQARGADPAEIRALLARNAAALLA